MRGPPSPPQLDDTWGTHGCRYCARAPSPASMGLAPNSTRLPRSRVSLRRETWRVPAQYELGDGAGRSRGGGARKTCWGQGSLNNFNYRDGSCCPFPASTPPLALLALCALRGRWTPRLFQQRSCLSPLFRPRPLRHPPPRLPRRPLRVAMSPPSPSPRTSPPRSISAVRAPRARPPRHALRALRRPPSAPAAPLTLPPPLPSDLSKDVTEVELTNIFKAFGTVTFVKIPRDVTTRASLGYAYVDFADVHQGVFSPRRAAAD